MKIKYILYQFNTYLNRTLSFDIVKNEYHRLSDYYNFYIIYTRGYPKIRGLFKYLLNVNVYCNEILSAYIVEYYQYVLKGTVNFVNKL
jgi:hypothetical protein